MKILNTTTGQIEDLLHTAYDCDCVPDIIASDDTITWTDDGEMKQGSEESIDWWRTFLTADAEFIAAKAELVAGLEHDQIAELEGLLNDSMGCDMEDQPAAGMQVLADFTNDVKAESQTKIMAIEKGSKVFVSEENQDGTVISISSDMFEVEFEDGEAGSYSRSEIEAL